jgi:hypothetical protein
MKKYGCILIIMIICQYNYGQENILIYQESSAKSINSIDDGQIINVKVNNWSQNDEFIVQFDNINIIAKKTILIDRGINGHGLWAVDQANSNNIIYLSLFDKKISGFINIDNEKYTVNTSKNGQYLLSKVDNTITIENKNDMVYVDDKSSTIPQKSSSTEKHKVIRMLVLYAQDAGTSQYVMERTLNAIDITNAVLENSVNNSNLTAKVELVYIGATSYSGAANENAILEMFRAPNDNQMDEVHQLRDLVQADVCVLFTSLGWGTAGIAYTGLGHNVGAAVSSAFMVVSPGYIDGFYVFAHELGHILGCKHNHAVETSSFQTVMGEYALSSTIPYFSNPNKTYNGVILGDEMVRNSAKAWSNNYNNVINFRIVPDMLNVTVAPISSSSYYQYRANESINASGINIPSGKTVSMRSKAITFQNGFSVNGQLELISE